MQRFDEYLAIEKKEQIQRATIVYILFGIPVILLFALSDGSIVGIEGTFKWRIVGLLPMLVSAAIYLRARMKQASPGYRMSQWLLTSIIIGVTIMMAALFYIVMTNDSDIDAIGLAGSIAGNLLAIFAVGTLRALPTVRVSLSLIIPYLVLVIAFLVSAEISVIKWVFTANIIAAIPLVLVIINQREHTDNARLLALFNLQEERGKLEQTVSDRTRELEVLLKELHHRVRNNLQIILSIINLYEHNYHSDTIMDKRFNMIRKAVQMMSDAHSLSYNEHIIERINMRLFFDEICSDDYWKQELTIDREIDDIFLNLETAVVIGFICIHLIPEADKSCHISLTSAGSGATLSVSTASVLPESATDYNFAILLSSLIRADVSSGIIDEAAVTRVSIPEMETPS